MLSADEYDEERRDYMRDLEVSHRFCAIVKAKVPYSIEFHDAVC